MDENRWLRQQLSDTAAILLIVSIAGFLRLWNLDSASFTYDAAVLANMAADFVATGQPPLQGMVSSTGVQNPALAVYLLSIPVMLRPGDPKIILTFIALLNTAAVGGVYWLGQHYWSRSVGALTALLFATGAWAVNYGRQIWAQSLLPPGVILWFAALLACVIYGSWRALVATIVIQAALIQLHFSAGALLPVTVIVLIMAFRDALRVGRINYFWRSTLIGISLSLSLYLPYLWAEAQHDWSNIRRVIGIVGAPSQLRLQICDLAGMLVGGRNIHSLAGAQRYQEFMATLIDPTYSLDRFIEILTVLTIPYWFVRLWRERRQRPAFRRDVLLLLWPVCVLLSFLRSSVEVYPHYFIVLYPAPYLVLAIAAANILRQSVGVQRWYSLRVAMAGVIGMCALWQSYLSLSIYHFVATHDTPGGWGEPIATLSTVTNRIEYYAERFRATDVIILCSGVDPRFDECPAVYRYLMRGTSHTATFMDRNDRNIWMRATDPESLVILTPGDGLAATELLQFAQSIPEADVSLRERADTYRFFRIHNPYQDIACLIREMAVPNDAIVLIGRDQRSELRRFYQGTLPVYELPEGEDYPASIAAWLAQIAAQHPILYVLFRSAEEQDPQGAVDAWLNAHAFGLSNEWLGVVRVAIYVSSGAESIRHHSQAVNADSGGRLRLIEYELSSIERKDTQILLLRLIWEAVIPVDVGYAVFVHLLDQHDHLVAQQDTQLIDRSIAAGLPRGDEKVENRIALRVPAQTKPGEYRLITGIYDRETKQRLPIDDKDHISLGNILVN